MSEEKYVHKDIEKKWQDAWAADELYKIPDSIKGKENFYLLTEFPYPSGDLHVGHWYAFSVPDILARTKRMMGYNVLYPFGFDAFGLPAENAAIKRGLNPRTWTEGNIETMTKQISAMGASFDWSRTLSTIDPNYYRWTQWQFLQFFKNDLAYQKKTPANWCPSCKTVLANEQVINGHCERCDSEVEKKDMLQWNMRITQYADRLIDDLEDLDWPEEIKASQRNWIGRSEGAEIDFALSTGDTLAVFTTRPDTLFGATYMVLAPEHELVTQHKDTCSNADAIDAYIKNAKKKSEIDRTAEGKEKTGVELKGITATNPASGESIPVWIADYVLAGYGTGAIMAVPAHDDRDYAFAKKFDLPIKEVVVASRIDRRNPPQEGKEVVERENVHVYVRNPKTNKILVLKWKEFPWVTFPMGGTDGEDPIEAARREVREETGYTNLSEGIVCGSQVRAEYYAAHKEQNRVAYSTLICFDLLDETREAVSESEAAQHEVMWLEPKELTLETMVHAEMDIWHEQLKKPEEFSIYTGPGHIINSGKFDGMDSEEAKRAITKEAGGRIAKTYKLRDWGVSRQRYWGVPIPIIHCKKCGPVAVPDKDLPVLLPEVDDYLPRDDGKSPLAKATKWMSAPCPECGEEGERETDTFDTFVDSSWYFLRYADAQNQEEFASKKALEAWMPVHLYSGGAEHTTMHVLYSRFWQKALFDLGLVKDPEPYTRRMNRSLLLGPDGNKMSKSKGNVINPDEVVERLGADTIRLYLSFIGPYNEVSAYPWSTDGIVGVRRFLERVWRLKEAISDSSDEDVERELHKTIQKVTESIMIFKLNTGVAQMMAFMNVAEKGSISKTDYKTFITLLAPYAPHITEELWSQLGEKKSVHLEEWPTYDEEKLKTDTITLAVQVNGKLRATIEVDSNAEESVIKETARDAVSKWLQGDPKKEVVVPGRLVNFVL